MRWVIASAAAVLVVVVVGTQLALPPIITGKIEDRLTKNGGTADASIHALPALRLLFHDGDEITVKANGVDIPVVQLSGGGFKRLDGFDEVLVQLTSSRIGPFKADRILIDRPEGSSLYDFTFRGSTTAGNLSSFALAGLPSALSGLITGLANTTRLGSGPIPIRLDATLRSDNGTAQLVRGTGTVAGIPLGGLAIGIAGAVVSRITS